MLYTAIRETELPITRGGSLNKSGRSARCKFS